MVNNKLFYSKGEYKIRPITGGIAGGTNTP